MPVVAVKGRQPLIFLTGNQESERSWATRICEDCGKQIVLLVGNTVELIAQAIAQSQIPNYFVRVLQKRAELRLAKSAGIIGRTDAGLIKKLRLSLRTDCAKQRQTMFCSEVLESTAELPV